MNLTIVRTKFAARLPVPFPFRDFFTHRLPDFVFRKFPEGIVLLFGRIGLKDANICGRWVSPVINKMAIEGPEPECLTRVRVFLDRNNRLKDLTTCTIFDTGKALPQPARAGKEIYHRYGGKRHMR